MLHVKQGLLSLDHLLLVSIASLHLNYTIAVTRLLNRGCKEHFCFDEPLNRGATHLFGDLMWCPAVFRIYEIHQ